MKNDILDYLLFLLTKKWFDTECQLECRLKRHELRKLANLKHRDPLNITLREKYHTVLKQPKNVLKQKRKEYFHNKISELEKVVQWNFDLTNLYITKSSV